MYYFNSDGLTMHYHSKKDPTVFFQFRTHAQRSDVGGACKTWESDCIKIRIMRIHIYNSIGGGGGRGCLNDPLLT